LELVDGPDPEPGQAAGRQHSLNSPDLCVDGVTIKMPSQPICRIAPSRSRHEQLANISASCATCSASSSEVFVLPWYGTSKMRMPAPENGASHMISVGRARRLHKASRRRRLRRYNGTAPDAFGRSDRRPRASSPARPGCDREPRRPPGPMRRLARLGQLWVTEQDRFWATPATASTLVSDICPASSAAAPGTGSAITPPCHPT